MYLVKKDGERDCNFKISRRKMLDLSRIGWNTNRQYSLRQAEGLDFEDMNAFNCYLRMKI